MVNNRGVAQMQELKSRGATVLQLRPRVHSEPNRKQVAEEKAPMVSRRAAAFVAIIAAAAITGFDVYFG